MKHKDLNEPNKIKEDSIIDVTNRFKRIDSDITLVKYEKGVPYWEHAYIYSFDDIVDASIIQSVFYKLYKTHFLNGVFLNLEGNDNYAFILLFNFLDDFKDHNDFKKLEALLKLLGKYYPKTRKYVDNFINRIIQEQKIINDDYILEQTYFETYQSEQYYYWNLGNKYKSQLNLNEEETAFLNRLSYSSNKFSKIEFCRIEILKLYLATISEMKDKHGITKDKDNTEFSRLSDLVARREYRFKYGSWNYNNAINSFPDSVYSNIYKHCENLVREAFDHKRMLKTDMFFRNPEVKQKYNSLVLDNLKVLFSELKHSISTPDKNTTLELNLQNTNRWKIQFGIIKDNYLNPDLFLDKVLDLGRLNVKNPLVENIYFEGAKFLSRYDKEKTLILYVYYFYYDLKSKKFKNKTFSKTVKKKLFTTTDQLSDFESILRDLKGDKDLDKAIELVKQVYKVKRKKIKLSRRSISEVEQKYSGTVELLDEYLQDDIEEEAKNEIIPIEVCSNKPTFKVGVNLNEIQLSLLELFNSNNLSISIKEVKEFSASKGIFLSQLIDEINENCFEILDDILIEEEEEFFTIDSDYFKLINSYEH